MNTNNKKTTMLSNKTKKILQEYADLNYTARQQAEGAWSVCSNLEKEIANAEKSASNAKTEKTKQFYIHNANCFRYNLVKQMHRASQLEIKALSLGQ